MFIRIDNTTVEVKKVSAFRTYQKRGQGPSYRACEIHLDSGHVVEIEKVKLTSCELFENILLSL